MQEREELKNQVQDYIVEVKRAEELLTSKVGICSNFADVQSVSIVIFTDEEICWSIH